jgi:hypothetical protein
MRESGFPSPGLPVTPRDLSVTTVEALRLALQATPSGPPSGGDLRRAVRLPCDEVRGKGLSAEQLLVLLKELWQSLPEGGQLPFGPVRREVLDQIITLYIEEYYAPPEPPGPRTNAEDSGGCTRVLQPPFSRVIRGSVAIGVLAADVRPRGRALCACGGVWETKEGGGPSTTCSR